EHVLVSAANEGYAPVPMSDELGFWALAQEDPEQLALVTPEGGEVTAGDLLAECNKLVHGLRALGLETGDAIAVVLPNSQEFVEVYLAALQAGFYLIPINHHLVGPEIAYIVADCEAKVFVGHERFADVGAAAADELDFPKEGRFAVGDIPSFRSFDELKAGQPTTRPDNRSTGQVM